MTCPSVCTRCWFTNGEDGDDHCGSCRCCGNCPECWHPLGEHSSETGVGCLHTKIELPVPGDPEYRSRATTCSCTRSGTSEADQ